MYCTVIEAKILMSCALFRKDFNERSRTLLKNKDTRAFKQSLVDQFRGLDADSLGILFSTKSQQVYMGKIGSGTKDVLYSIGDNEPIAVDMNSKNELLPTLYFLSKFPMALRQLVVHSPVSEYVLNGADLMMPGVCTTEGLEDIQLNEIVSIRVKGNPIPFAVGTSLVSWEGIQHNGMRGRGVRVLHYYGDMMCYKWNKNAPINEGFSLTCVRALPGYVETTATVNQVEDSRNEMILDHDIENSLTGAVENTVEKGDCIEQDFQVLSLGHNVTSEVEVGITYTEDEAEHTLAATQHEMDLALEICLLRALYYIIKDRHLPMLVSSLWALLLRCVVEDEPKLDIKQSTVRKATVFLNRYSGEAGLLTIITDDTGVSQVTAVNRTHRLFKCPAAADVEVDVTYLKEDRIAPVVAASNRLKTTELLSSSSSVLIDRILHHAYRVPDPEEFRSRLRPMVERDIDTPHTSAGLPSQGIVGDHVRLSKGKASAIKVVELFRPTRPFREMLGDAAIGEFGECLTASEVRSVMLSYLSDKEFPVAEGGSSVEVPVDDPLYKHLQLAKRLLNRKPPNDKTNSISMMLDQSLDWEVEEVNHDVENDGRRGCIVAGVYMPSVDDFIRQAVTPTTIGTKQGETTTSAAGNTDILSTRELLAQKGTGRPVELPSVPGIQKNTNVFQPVGQNLRVESKDPVSKSADESTVSVKKDRKQAIELIGEAPQQPVLIQKKDVVKKTLSRFAPYFVVINGSGECRVSSGTIPHVQIDVEKRSGNKMVTKLSGISSFGIDCVTLARDCQKKFACSASIAASSTRINTMEIAIQGFVVDELSQMLIENYGLPKSVIVVNMAKGVKAKKKM